MPRCIDADTLVGVIDKWRSIEQNNIFDAQSDAELFKARNNLTILDIVRDYILGMKAADVEEVRHGEWEEVTTNAIDDLAFDTVASMRCSKCDRYHNRVYHYGDPTEMEHYCSFCGAKMDGGKE